MNLQEMMNQMTALGGQIRDAAAKLAKDSGNQEIPLADLEAQQKTIADMQQRMSALQASYDAMKGNKEGGLKPMENTEKKTRSEILASKEYARAFAYALRHGVTRRNGLGNENVKILFDALTEGGGDPVGTDGGFLVPEDIDNSIRELRRELNPLAALFTEEEVSTLSGWRVIDTAPTTAMPSIDEMGTIANNSDQPAFAKVTYTLVKYGLRIPVSNELLNDEVANLMAYLSRWFAKKLVITENSLLLAALKTLSPTTIAASADPIAAIKGVLNKTLDPAISARAVIITNQNGFDALDQLTDEMGRGMLQPDPTNATVKRLLGRQVVAVSNAMLPDTSSKPEFFIGDMKEFATLFRRNRMEVASTDIGGSAWATDSTEVRGLVRMCVSKFDAAAAARRQLALS